MLRYFSTLSLAALMISTGPVSASENNSFAEYTQSLDASTFEKIKTIGLFARSYYDHGEIVYGGLQFSHFEPKNSADSSGLYRVLIGVTTAGRVAPYLEIGTDILGLFTSSNNRQVNCGNVNNCRIDGFLKVGVRLRFQYAYTIGVFHESIAFSNNHRSLKGDHDYTGMSIGYHF